MNFQLCVEKSWNFQNYLRNFATFSRHRFGLVRLVDIPVLIQEDRSTLDRNSLAARRPWQQAACNYSEYMSSEKLRPLENRRKFSSVRSERGSSNKTKRSSGPHRFGQPTTDASESCFRVHNSLLPKREMKLDMLSVSHRQANFLRASRFHVIGYKCSEERIAVRTKTRCHDTAYSTLEAGQNSVYMPWLN
jgi:hypothetical protein